MANGEESLVTVTIYNASKRVYGDVADPKTAGQVVVEFYEGKSKHQKTFHPFINSNLDDELDLTS